MSCTSSSGTPSPHRRRMRRLRMACDISARNASASGSGALAMGLCEGLPECVPYAHADLSVRAEHAPYILEPQSRPVERCRADGAVGDAEHGGETLVPAVVGGRAVLAGVALAGGAR